LLKPKSSPQTCSNAHSPISSCYTWQRFAPMSNKIFCPRHVHRCRFCRVMAQGNQSFMR
jgi:hypothetical protein